MVLYRISANVYKEVPNRNNYPSAKCCIMNKDRIVVDSDITARTIYNREKALVAGLVEKTSGLMADIKLYVPIVSEFGEVSTHPKEIIQEEKISKIV